MTDAVFHLDLDQSFPRLARPPIVEAAIHWQSLAQRVLEPAVVAAKLAERLPQYGVSEPIQQVELTAMVSRNEAAPVVRHQRAWHGLRLKSADGQNVVQFKTDGVVYSRTHNYEHWEPFVAAGKVAWLAFVDIAAPADIQRLGVRFINHVATATPEDMFEYLREPPTCPSHLPLKEFVYQSTFHVPGVPLGVRITKVMQPSMPELQQSSGLFIDIDVFTVKVMSTDPQELDATLTKMRWLKNKVFFELLTDQAVQAFGVRP